MWMGKSAIGILITFLLVFFTLPNAAAHEATSSASKIPKKKALSARKTSSVKVKIKKFAPIKASAKRRNAGKIVRTATKIRTNNKKKIAYRPKTPVKAGLSASELARLNRTLNPLKLHSNVVYVVDQSTSEVLFAKNSDVALPIASLTKLMTGLVVIEAGQDMQELLEVTTDDVDRLKHTSSRLPIGAKLSRADMLHIALMSSENRAASVLGRNFPGGLPAFVTLMNVKAMLLGMNDTHYVEPTGLSSENVASASDLAKLVEAASGHDLLRSYSTYDKHSVRFDGKKLNYRNSNRLVGKEGWDIELQKTGYIREAGRCVVMQLNVDERAVTMVFLDSKSTYSRSADANHMLSWLQENTHDQQTASAN